jgi:formate--tetrahydrofolate ligase
MENLLSIDQVASDLELLPTEVEPYGKDKAKISLSALDRVKERKPGKLVLVTTTTPTPLGEGKTTTTIGLADAFRLLGKKSVICLREPSMGPIFGVKGGATGGGAASLIPQNDINLHFTGDMHAVTSAHNLLVAVLDNHLHQGNELDIDPRTINIRRVIDMNDRSLRNLVIGLGGPQNGIPRESGFDITASSEIMAILCLSESLESLKERLGRVVVGFNRHGKAITTAELKVQGALAALLKDAIKPNLVRTREGTPAFVHGGPFANIAHGCNSIIATKMALGLGEIVVTEAGFSTDLGAEKFFNIKCRMGNIEPDAVVLVASIRALKLHGGMKRTDLAREGISELARGFENLAKHVENIRFFGLPCVVAINRFAQDTQNEIDSLFEAVRGLGLPVALSEVFEKGGEGGKKVAALVNNAFETGKKRFDYLYPLEMPIIEKMNVISRCCYGADGVTVLKAAKEKIAHYEALGYRNLPVCMAKTQHSLSDIPGVLGRPQNFRITVRDVRLSAGAGFIVAIAGDIMTMPGLPQTSAAEHIDVDETGNIIGLS